MIQSYRELQTELTSYADDAFRSFAMKGIPSERPFLGVRIPKIRAIVKTISFDRLTSFIKIEPYVFEEVLARGMMICRLDFKESLPWFDSQIEYIDDWCNCDTFCTSYAKLIHNHETEFFENKIEALLKSNLDYTVRAGLVFLLASYVKPEYLNVIFDRIEILRNHKAHYVRMAIAWLIAECFIKYPSTTTDYLTTSYLPDWTFNKVISKICDSHRVNEDAKAFLRKMRK
ncbi:DNA alkylation repair protein [Candidatus Saccharibacteria bacterium]|nr:DNA alkylation repair protein [Candidatus Saccharibacteria bacterium]